MEPTERQMSRAHAAFEAASEEWTLREVVGIDGRAVWLLEHTPPYLAHEMGRVSAHKFYGAAGRQQALLMKRDKILRCVLKAGAALDETQ